MPQNNFVVSGVVYDTDGTTVLASVAVDILDTDKNVSARVITNSLGQYVYDLANLSGFAIGDEISLFVSYARNYKEYIFITDSSGVKEQNLTLSETLPTSVVYCSVQDIRDFTNISSSEFSNNQIMKFIEYATNTIDERTARTWKGVQTVSNELYNGDDTDLLTLTHPDLQSVTAISIDDDGDGTYTSITSGAWFIDNEGGGATSMVVLNVMTSDITNFVGGVNTVKISYTWGFSKPTKEVRLLCVLMVSNMVNRTSAREKDIEARIRRLAWSGPMRPV